MAEWSIATASKPVFSSWVRILLGSHGKLKQKEKRNKFLFAKSQ